MPTHQRADHTGWEESMPDESVSIFCVIRSCPCAQTDMAASVSVAPDAAWDRACPISVCMLNMDGTKNGTSSLQKASSHRTRNVLFGIWLISAARTSTTAMMKTAPEKLISHKLILIRFIDATSLQVLYDLL